VDPKVLTATTEMLRVAEQRQVQEHQRCMKMRSLVAVAVAVAVAIAVAAEAKVAVGVVVVVVVVVVVAVEDVTENPIKNSQVAVEVSALHEV